MELRVGTSGWSYPDWVGPFYPKGTPAGEMLTRYASVFDAVEVNSSFYAPPPRERVARWAAQVPEDFTFSLKAPRTITHDQRLEATDALWRAVDRFLAAIEPLGAKLGTVLLQLPPSLTAHEGLPRLEGLLAAEPFPAHVAVEARHTTWEREAVFDALSDHGVTWVWSQNQHWTSPAVVTSERAYVRFIGDRSIERFDRVQRDVSQPIGDWWARLGSRQEELSSATVFANNHFAGFGPATVNLFLEVAGRAPRTWSGGAGSDQAGLDAFL